MAPDPSCRLIGVLHLLPLPAAPSASPGFAAVLARALADADALVSGGAWGCIIENLGDAPFTAGAVDPHVPAMLAVLGDRLRARYGRRLALGINVLRNDARAALGAAAACDADFIRINVHNGATWTDQGLIQGQAHQTLRYRRELGLAPAPGQAGLRIAADLLVKHGVPAGDSKLERVALDTAGRGGADMLILTGEATGAPASIEDLRRVRALLPDAELWVGSGVNADTAPQLRGLADAAIVGTALHEDADLWRPLDPARVSALAAALT